MCHGTKISTNLPKPIKPYARKPKQLNNAKATTTLCDAFTPGPDIPKRVASHSAPVVALERRSHLLKNIIMNTWLKTGQSQGIHMLFMPYTKHRATIHMVPLMSNMSEASLKPNKYQGNDLPPNK